MAVNPASIKSQRRGCRGCLSKLIIPVILLALCGGCLLLSPLLLRLAGFLPPTAEERYAGAPDPVAGAMVDEMLRLSGIEGTKTYVLPIKGSSKHLAVVTMDKDTKFKPDGTSAQESVIRKTISGLANINDTGLDIERTVVAYRDKDDKLLVAFTVAQSDLEAYDRGETTRAEFLEKLDADLSGLLDAGRVQALVGTAELEGLPEVNQADAEFVAGAAVEWAIGKKLVSINCPPPYDDPACQPSLNAAEVARFQASQNQVLGLGLGIFGARSVNQEAVTALGAAQVAAKLAQADTLADEGLAQGDPGKFDQAIALRPGDWSLRDKQAALRFSQGDTAAAGRALSEAEKLVDEQVQAGGDCLTLQKNLYRNRQAAFGRAAELNPGNRAIDDQLAQTQTTLTTLENGQNPGLCP